MRRRKEVENKNLTVAFFFCSFVFLLIVISVIIKIFFVVSQVKFDGEHYFNVLFFQNNNQFDIISFSPDTEATSILKVQLKNKEKIDIGKLNFIKLFKIPIDGIVDSKRINQPLSFNNKNLDSSLQTILLNSRKLTTNLTFIDFLRLWIFSKKVPSHGVSIKEIAIFLPPNQDEESLIDGVCSQIFIDNTLMQEKISIQIINGTGVSGLANRLAKLIINMGGNVISVTTADEIINNSEIAYFGEKTYTLGKLKKTLGFKEKKTDKQTISDLLITIGEDSLSALKF